MFGDRLASVEGSTPSHFEVEQQMQTRLQEAPTILQSRDRLWIVHDAQANAVESM